MGKRYLSLPFSVELTSENGWLKVNPGDTTFFIARFHLLLEERQLNEPHAVGEKLAVYSKPKASTSQVTDTTEFEHEDIRIVESLQASLMESRMMATAVQSIGATVKAGDFLKLNDTIRTEVTGELRNQFSTQFRIEESSMVREKRTFQVTNTLGADIDKPVVAVPVYQRCAFDIYLAYVDWLYVEYRRRIWGLRRMRQKMPQPASERKNVCRSGEPLGQLRYWRHLPKSSELMYESDYQAQYEGAIQHPEETEIVPLNRQPRAVEFPRVASLYQIAEVAFPKKWIRRSGPWTEEELMKVELDDVPTWWSDRFGKGGPSWHRRQPK